MALRLYCFLLDVILLFLKTCSWIATYLLFFIVVISDFGVCGLEFDAEIPSGELHSTLSITAVNPELGLYRQWRMTDYQRFSDVIFETSSTAFGREESLAWSPQEERFSGFISTVVKKCG